MPLTPTSLMRPALGALAVLAFTSAYGQLTVTPQTDLQQLAASITGPGVQITNPVITCHSQGYGEFTYSGNAMDVDQGVILTTGRRTDAPGPNNNGGSNWFAQNTAGDAVLNNVTGRTTMDACKFEFDIIPAGDSLSFDFVFASEEYNEWVNSQYNDVFGFFISGPGIVGDPGAGGAKNIALIPNTSTPVTINNVNNGSHSAYYHDNTGGAHLQYDGFTVGLTAKSLVTPCVTYHLKLVVADASDRKYDSGVFIDKVESPTITMTSHTATSGQDMIEGCNNGWVRFDRGIAEPTPLALTYYIQGTATNGTDYTAIAPINPNSPKTIIIPANQTYVDRPVDPLADMLNENSENLLFILGNPNCPGQYLDSLTFNILDTLIATISPGATICLGGSWPLTVTGGASYAWSPATGLSCTTCPNPIATPTTTTTYTVVITDGLCTRTANRTVRVSNLSLSAALTHPLCNGNVNGAINLSHVGGYPPYTYAWTGPNGFTASSQDISGLATGTYTVTVTDAGCTRSQSFTLTAPAALGVSLSPTILAFGQNLSCFGGSDGVIDATVSGGTGPYATTWSGPNGYSNTVPDITGLSVGTYTLNVTDAQGCTASASSTLIEATQVVAAINTSSPVACFGDGQGSATVTPSGGVPPYAISWNTTPVQNGTTATGLLPGTWTVTVTDGYNCPATANVTIGGPTAALSTSLTAQTNVLCFGNSTGSASISISGGTAPYTTSWNTSPVQNGTSASNLPTGTWTATVTDANGCSTTRSVTITQPASGLNASLFAQTNVSCFGQSTGSATVSVSGGTGPYTYQWNTTPVQNTATASNLAAGSYTCTVRDVNLCTTTVNVTITQPAGALSANISASTNVLCYGASTGSASVTASGGTAPLSYSWNTTPAQTTATANNLPAGNYTVTVTDALGCNLTRNVTISQPAEALQANLLSNTNETCSGSLAGSATLSVTGGSGSYNITWNTVPVQTGLMATGLAAGNYTATITDNNSCPTIATVNVTITGPTAALGATISSSTNVLCFGNSTGSATVSVSGGTPSYSYSWNSSPVQTTATVSNLPAGNYTCTITDANGCTTTANVTITQPSALSANVSGSANALCFGNSTGSATVSASGGTPAYSYSWNSSPVQSTATASNLPAGNYTCTITDANGCTTTANVTITQPPAALNVTATVTPAACQGANSGAVDATVTGGTGTYSYAWTGPNGFTASIPDLTALQAGVYQLVVTDANGCTHTSTWNVNQPGLFTVSGITSSFTGGVEVSCAGGANGSIDMTVSGATPPYDYSWSGPGGYTSIAEDISGLQAGTYTFIVTDANGCATSQVFTLDAPQPFDLNLIGADQGNGFNITCNGGNNGSINATITWGTAPLNIGWTGPGGFNSSNEDISGLIAGTYDLTISDANGCGATQSITLSEPAAIALSANATSQVLCFGNATGTATSNATGGVAPIGYSWNTAPAQTSPNASGLSAGTWTVTATDANGCSTTAGATITAPAGSLSASLTASTDVDCFGNATGSATASAADGTGPYNYSWNSSPAQTSTTATNLAAGNYLCTITDANGCTALVSATIGQPAQALSAGMVSQNGVSCLGAQDGTATAEAMGGTAPYSYVWNSAPAQNGTVLNSVGPGSYTVTVTDDNGCSASALATIGSPSSALSVSLLNATHQSCFGSANGQASVSASGGTAPFTYTWNTVPPQTSASAVGLSAGTYLVNVEDAHGCSASLNVTINGPSAPLSVQTTSISNVLCHGAATGSASVTAAGGTAPYTYTWNTSPMVLGADLQNVAVGTYTVQAVDANGCTTSTNVTITQPTAPLHTFVESYANVSCFGGSDGYATVEISGGSGSYTVVWNTIPPQAGTTATGLSTGIWTVSITDNNGCSIPKFLPVTITEPAAPLAIASILSDFGGFNVSCPNSEDGWIDVTLSGGTWPYNYAWTDDFGGLTGIEDVSGLSAGNYYLTVSDGNGCTVSATYALTAPSPLLASANITTAACQGASDGAVDVDITGGTAPYTYAWSGPNGYAATSEDINAIAAGTYALLLTDANGCTLQQSFDVNQPGMFNITAVLSDFNGSGVSCAGSTDGSIDVTTTGGTAPYLFNWTGPNGFTSVAEDISGLIAGEYFFTVTDANGCGTLQAYSLTEPVVLHIITVAVQYGNGQISCMGGNDGSIDATISGGTPNYTIAWSGPNGFSSSTEDLANLSAGTYTISATDLNGCTATVSVTLNEPPALTASASVSQTNSGDAIACNGGSDGSIDLQIQGGNAPYSVAWSGPNGYTSNATDPTGLGAGTYTALITDANGCTTSINSTLTEPAPLVLTSAVSSFIGGNAISCNGANDGSIDLTLTGGAGDVQFQWTGSNAFTSTDEDLSGLDAGFYQVLVMDQNGCSAGAFFLLNEPQPIGSTASIVTALCQGTASGAVDMTVTGGTAPYDIAWSGPNGFTSTSEDLANLFAGVYIANITDANGCTSMQFHDVDEPGVFVLTELIGIFPGGFNTSCSGFPDGSIELTATGGTPGYTYSWYGPSGYSASSEDISGLFAGQYSVILTDANGCSTLGQYTLVSADPVVVGLVAGSFFGGANTSCADTPDGSIDATIVGGITPYSVNWNGPNGFVAIGEDLTGLEPGMYSVEVTDAVGCTADASITLTAPDPVDVVATATTYGGNANVSCFGAMDGAIDLAITGGSLPYDILWAGPNGFVSSQEDVSGLGHGVYSYSVTDANGCKAYGQVNITTPPPIDFSLNASQFNGGYNIPCAGGQSGSINTVAMGGTGNLSYAWNGPNGFTSSDANLSNLEAGAYTLTVTDDNGCTASTSITLTAPQPLSVTDLLSDAGNGYQISCAANDGSIDLTVNGGTAPTQTSWSGPNGFGSQAEDISGLEAGTYDYAIIDGNGCTSAGTFVLTAPTPLTATLGISGNICDGTDDGAIDISLAGGVAPYNFSWTGPNGFASANEDLSNLSAGNYAVTVSDAGTCTGSWNATITASAAMDLSAYVSTYGNLNIPCVGDSTGVIEVQVNGGAAPVNAVWTGPNGFAANNITDLSGLVAGDYTVTLTDGNGCVLDTSITLTGPTSQIAPSMIASLFASGTNISCLGASDGSVDLTVTGGTAPYLFDWRGPDSTQYSTEDINGLIAGTYDLVITDSNQCTFPATITLTEPDSALVAQLALSQFNGGYNTSCDGSTDGTIAVQLLGGSNGYQLSWSGPNGFSSTADSLSGLAAGTYTLTATDMNGCVLIEGVVVAAPDPLDPLLTPFAFPSGSNTSCAGMNDGSIALDLSGGVPNFMYSWTGPNGFSGSDASITDLEPGTYCLHLTDANGCSTQACTDVIAAQALDASTTTSAADCGASTGSVDLSVQGGGAPFTFDWDHGAQTEDLTGLLPGQYTVTITDVNGCSLVESATVSGSPALLADANVTNTACNASAIGAIDLTVISGTAPYDFAWSNGMDTEDLAGLASDAYTITVTDAAGCSWTNTYVVSQGSEITADSLVMEYPSGYNLSGYESGDGSITVAPSGGTEPYTYAWSNGATSAMINGLAAGTYTVIITDANGCSLTLEFTLDQPMDLVMPTGYTPNGDGSNDHYVVHGLDAFKENHITIFNRWGNVVYDRINYTNDWGGENLQGEMLPNGTYFVVLTLNKGGQTLQNYVDLRR